MNTDDLFLGIDIGTTSCKCFVYDNSLKQVGGSVREYPTIRTREGWIEQDPNDWKQTLIDCIRDLDTINCFRGQNIRGISVSSQGITFVPVDLKGSPLRNAITWLDNRASVQAEYIMKTFGALKIRDITGIMLTSSYVLPKLLWLYDNEAETASEMKKLLFPHDYIVKWLTGETLTDHTLAAGSMLYDINKGKWSEEICYTFDIPMHILPDLSYAGERVGKILPEIADELAISADAVISTGGQDQKCAFLGSLARKGDLTVSLGTASAISTSVSSKIDPEPGFTYSPYLFRDTGILEGVVPSAGASIKWLKDLIFTNMSYDEVRFMAEQKQKNGGTTLLFDPDLSLIQKFGASSVPKGKLTGISLSTDREDMALALYEGICFGISRQINKAVSMSGYADGEIILFGGGTADRLWCGMIADMTGRDVTICDTDQTASRGAAMLASGMRNVKVKDVRVISPDLDRHLIYRKKADIFEQIYNTNNDTKVDSYEE